MDEPIPAKLVSKYDTSKYWDVAMLHVLAQRGEILTSNNGEGFVVRAADGSRPNTLRFTKERAAIAFCLANDLPLE